MAVELCHKGFDVEKYARWDRQKHFAVKPDLFVVSDAKIPKLDYQPHVVGMALKIERI